MNHPLTLALTASLALVGCAAPAAEAPWPQDTLYDAPPPPPDPNVDEYGQYRFTDSTLYRGNKPSRRGDHVVVLVTHAVTGDANATTSLKRKSESGAEITAFFGLETAIPELAPGFTPSASLGGSDEHEYNGKGGTNRTGALQTVVTAKVLDVQANGYLVIGARQQVKINNEIDVLTLYGVVDPKLIDADNSIRSHNVSDLRMAYTGIGVVAGKQQPGWLSRVLDVVRPF